MKIDFKLAHEIANGPSTDPRILGETEAIEFIRAASSGQRRVIHTPVVLINLPEDKGGLVLHVGGRNAEQQDVMTPAAAAHETAENMAEVRDVHELYLAGMAEDAAERQQMRLSFACIHDATLANRRRLGALFGNAAEGARQDPVLVEKLQAAQALFTVGEDEKPLLGAMVQPDRERGELTIQT